MTRHEDIGTDRVWSTPLGRGVASRDNFRAFQRPCNNYEHLNAVATDQQAFRAVGFRLYPSIIALFRCGS